MILSPGILALLAISTLLAAYACYAAGTGLHIVVGWDTRSTSSAQLLRERKTTLLSSILGVIMVAEVFCLVLFVALADRLHGFFAGAMCAAGTLNANAYGYPALLVMLAGCILCVLWLTINHLDALAQNYPLIRLKYLCLIPLAALLGAQAFLLVSYFARLNPTVITSCCATIFSEEGRGLGSDLAHLSPRLMQPIFWATLTTTLGIGVSSLAVGALDKVYSSLSVLMLPLGLAAIISFISIRIYELPTHHCPFCILQRAYGYAGYLLYGGLLLGTALGIGAGLVRGVGSRAALRDVAPSMARRLKFWSLAGYALLGLVAARPLVCSDFRLSAIGSHHQQEDNGAQHEKPPPTASAHSIGFLLDRNAPGGQRHAKLLTQVRNQLCYVP